MIYKVGEIGSNGGIVFALHTGAHEADSGLEVYKGPEIPDVNMVYAQAELSVMRLNNGSENIQDADRRYGRIWHIPTESELRMLRSSLILAWGELSALKTMRGKYWSSSGQMQNYNYTLDIPRRNHNYSQPLNRTRASAKALAVRFFTGNERKARKFKDKYDFNYVHYIRGLKGELKLW